MARQSVPGKLETGVMRVLALLLCALPLFAQPVIKVSAGGSIQKALDEAPSTGALINIEAGTYREVVSVNKPNITLRGLGVQNSDTVIVFDKSAGTAGGTSKSATVNITADNFTGENLTFSNDFNRTHEQVQAGSQALAVAVTGSKAIFRNMRFLGNQDTVYAAKGTQYFTHCYIEGNVDFIFGDAKAFFDHCELHNTPHKAGGYVTAQSKNSPDQDSAYIFDHCRLTAEPGQTRVYLGRPWRPYAAVIFLNTEMGPHIEAAGWREWHAGETKSLETAYYAEYNSTGPGANAAKRDAHSHQLTAAEAAKYEVKTFFQGWDPR